MSETNSLLYWVGGVGAGIFMSGLSAGGMWLLESKKPSAKTIGRDFILGAILFFIILQLIPESTMALVSGLVALVPSMSGGAPVIENVIETLTSDSNSDVEVRVGVPGF